jgi:methyl-accepting chemotaxis protein
MWPKPGNENPVPKISYVKGFEPWGWIIGSGIYIDDIDATFQQKLLSSLLLGAVIAVLLLLVSIGLGRTITQPLKSTISALHDIARGEGDLTQRLAVVGKDEVCVLSTEFNAFMDKLQRMIQQIEQSTASLTEVTHKVSVISDEASTAVTKQQGETDQVAAAITQLSSSAHSVAENANQTSGSTDQAAQQARESHSLLTHNRDTINQLDKAVQNVTGLIQNVDQRSEEIGGILTTINGNAEQTNLLALNAAIEAARAGEQGRGFAVVADEVRSLAQSTREATEEIERMIVDLQGESREAVKAMQEGEKLTAEGVTSTEQTSETLSLIVSNIGEINSMTSEIANAASEQANVVGDINRNIINISTIAGESSERSVQTDNAMHEMKEQLDTLKNLIAQFKV